MPFLVYFLLMSANNIRVQESWSVGGTEAGEHCRKIPANFREWLLTTLTGSFRILKANGTSSLMLLHLTFPLIPLEITFFLEIKHLQIKRLLVKLESWTFFIKLSGGAYQRARYCTYIVIWCMRVLLLYVDIYVHIHIIYKVFMYMLWFPRTAHTDTPPTHPHTLIPGTCLVAMNQESGFGTWKSTYNSHLWWVLSISSLRTIIREDR